PEEPGTEPDPGTNPEEPGTEPGTEPDPGTNPEEPGTEPDPGTNPEEPGTEPDPGTNPEEPGTEPDPGMNPEEPGTEPDPGTNPEEPGTEPDPGTNPEEPGTEPDPGTNPEEPGTEPDPGTNPEEPGTEPDPGTNPEEPGTEPDPGTNLEDPGTEPEEPPVPVVLIDATYDAAASGETYSIPFDMPGEWSVSKTPDIGWCRVSPDRGSAGKVTVSITIDANDTSGAREVALSFTAPNATGFIKIEQKRQDVFTVTPTEFSLDAEGGEIEIVVTTNITYSYNVEGSPFWISEIKSGVLKDVIRYKVAQNTSVESRNCNIVFSGGKSPVRVSVRQSGVQPDISVSPKTCEVGQAGGSVDVAVTANVPFEVEIPTSAPWVTLARKSDAGITLQVAENTSTEPRSAVVKVKNAAYGISRTVTVSQARMDVKLSVTPTSVSVAPEGGEFEIAVSSNVEWSVLDLAVDWLTDLGGTATARRFKVQPNAGLSSRSTQLVFRHAASGSSAYVAVSQKAAQTVIIKDHEIHAPVEGGRFTTALEYNVSFTARYPGNMVENIAFENNTNGKCDLVIQIKPNDSSLSREGDIEILVDNVVIDKIHLTQDAVEQPGGNPGGGDDPDGLDGKVKQLQTHSQGNGIPIVIMGDAFLASEIEDGTYEDVMENAMNTFFSIEPYTTFRNLFDVYMVNVVSTSKAIGTNATALKTKYGTGTRVEGDNDKCFAYALKAVTQAQLVNTLVITMLNDRKFSGTCYMTFNPNSEKDYAEGRSVAYFALGTKDGEFAQLLHHEANGHGFGKLQDEYFYDYMGTIPASDVQTFEAGHKVGLYRNVSYTAEPEKVYWKHLMDDSRYAGAGLGIFEGAAVYAKGAYRSTDYSIMRNNVGNFNPISREIIYYRIHKIAYGDSWTFDYEDFVKYDAKNLNAAGRDSWSQPVRFVPLPPPVLIAEPR
ncbi:MAG: hypothetical protein HUJ91_06585, partial [Bacteroidales bacterium]|nr:hypothetical protein [Bacteroidales bacterium]